MLHGILQPDKYLSLFYQFIHTYLGYIFRIFNFKVISSLHTFNKSATNTRGVHVKSKLSQFSTRVKSQFIYLLLNFIFIKFLKWKSQLHCAVHCAFFYYICILPRVTHESVDVSAKRFLTICLVVSTEDWDGNGVDSVKHTYLHWCSSLNSCK